MKPPADWRLGTAEHRGDLVTYIWARSTGLIGTDPARASD
jgi:hypothetical protein